MDRAPATKMANAGTPGRDADALPEWFVVREVTAQGPEWVAAAGLLAGTAALPGVPPEFVSRGRVFVACDPAEPRSESVVAAVLVLPCPDATAELVLVAVAPAHHDRCPTDRLLGSLADALRAEGLRSLAALVGPRDSHFARSLPILGFRATSGDAGDGMVRMELEL